MGATAVGNGADGCGEGGDANGGVGGLHHHRRRGRSVSMILEAGAVVKQWESNGKAVVPTCLLESKSASVSESSSVSGSVPGGLGARGGAS